MSAGALAAGSVVVFNATHDSFLRNTATVRLLRSLRSLSSHSHSLPQALGNSGSSVVIASQQSGGVASFTTDEARDQNVYQGNNATGVSGGACPNNTFANVTVEAPGCFASSSG